MWIYDPLSRFLSNVISQSLFLSNVIMHAIYLFSYKDIHTCSFTPISGIVSV